MITKTREKTTIGAMALLRRDPTEIKKVIRETAGLWRNRKLDPIKYQRAMRKLYATVRR
ncbi:hypothetical protein HYZ80_01635 [Candidatus Parcubacteria bacterium]|nr:hypothetical protein [Candidatus Parcubacteria bacterium]